MEEYKQFWTRWSDFEGRSTVREYWMVFLINFLISAILGGLGYAAGFFSIVSYIYAILTLIPGIAIFIRRMHDVDKSGWYWLWLLLPLIGLIMVLIKLIEPSH